MRISEEMLEKAALAIRETKEFQVGAAFGVPTTAHESYSTALAEAAVAAVLDIVYSAGYTSGYEEKYHDVYGEGYDDGYRDGRDR